MHFKRSKHIAKCSKLASFTMMDILTGMVIISLVISMAFYLLSAVSKQSYDYQSVRIELNDYILMNNDIKREVDLCKTIYEIPNGFILSSQNREIKYRKSGDYLLREVDLMVDTLNDNCSEINFEYQEAETNQSKKMIIDIVLITKIKEQSFTSYFHKDYGIAEPINFALINEF